ncbi:MAG: serine/threonine-protein kinase [Myxococcota bacterium]
MAEARYQVLRLISRGGAAEVYEAVAHGEAGFRRRVAIKRLHQTELELRTAFLDEARILGAISHPNVIAILGVGAVDGALFQVLELVDGLDLAALRETLDSAGAELPPALGLHIGAEIAKGLDAVHRARDAAGRTLGVVHRDITPRNVLLSWEGAVKVADFGTAYAESRSTRTRPGFTKGTPRFMSPEQVAGAPLDGRADLFSLGRVLRFLLPGPLPPNAERLLESLVAADRRQRPPDADAVAAALDTEARRIAAEDPGRALREWLKRWSPRTAEPTPKLAGLFDYEASGASLDDGLQSYTSIVRHPTQTVPTAVPEETRTLVEAPRLPPPPRRASLSTGQVAALVLAAATLSILSTLLLLRPSAPPAVEILPVRTERPIHALSATAAATLEPAPAEAEPEPAPTPARPAPPRSRPERREEPRPTKRDPAAEIQAEVQHLEERLGHAQLRREDLPPRLLARWDAAAGASSAPELKALWGELEPEIERVRTSAPVLKRRLERAGSRLRAADSASPAAEVEALEQAYFGLRKQLAEPLSPKQGLALADEIEAFERRLAKLR